MDSSVISYRDQRNLFNPKTFTSKVNIVGLGSIGQAVFPLLLKLGVQEFDLWDDDMAAEPHNIPVQLLSGPAHVGIPKVEVCEQFAHDGWLAMGEDFIIRTHRERVTADTRLSGIVIAATDSMGSRKEIWQAVKRNLCQVHFYMDGRIGGLQWELLALVPAVAQSAKNYETFLVGPKHVSEAPCGASDAIHVPEMLACHMVERLRRFHKGILTTEDFWAMDNLGLEE